MARNKKRILWSAVAALVGVAALVTGAATTGLIPARHTAVAGAEKASPKTARQLAAPAETAAVSVTAARVTIREVQRTVQAVGNLTGFDEVTVTAEVQGRVKKIFFDVGDTVRPRDVLLELDPTDYELTAQEARTALDAELAKLVPDEEKRRALATMVAKLVAEEDSRRAFMEKLNKLGPSALLEGALDVDNLPTVKRAKEQEKNALSTYERAKQLYARQVTTEEMLEQLQTVYEVARNSRLQAVMDTQTTLATACFRAAMLATAEHKLRNTKVLVPESTAAARSGLKDVEYSVARRRVDEGEMVKDSPSATAAVYDLVIDTILKFAGTVPERYAGEVKKGQKVALRVDAYPDKVFEGTITRISPTVDRLSRTFQIEAEVKNADRELKPGGFAKGEIQTRKDPKAKTVSSKAVVRFAGTTKVFAVREGKVRAVPVALGVSQEGWAEVIGELAPGSLVVTSAREELVDGTPVRIREVESDSPRSKQPEKAK